MNRPVVTAYWRLAPLLWSGVPAQQSNVMLATTPA
jgi:hypothetical protein